MFNLRDYQQRLKDQIHDAWGRVRAVLAVCPTGGGKTVIFASIIHDHNGAAAAIVHRKEIVSQISLSLARLGVKHRVVAPDKTIRMIRRKHLKQLGKSFVDPQALCGVVSVQTMTSKSSGRNKELQRWLSQVTLGVYDEGHHYVRSGLWAKAVEVLANAKLLFVTATPERADGKGLGTPELGGDGFCEEMVEGPTTRWLIKKGFLSRFSYHAPDTDLNVEGLAVTASGDFNAKALRARVVESHIVGDVVRHYARFADGQSTIVFASDVETAGEMAAAFRAAGYTAAALSGETDQGEREATLADFEAGRIQILVNVDLFDEGFDVPSVVGVMLARPTESLGKYLQMVGRALRILEGKEKAIVMDVVRNWERHGMPDWPRVWTLKSRDKRNTSDSDTIPQKICLNEFCTQPYEAFYKACPYCGHVPVPPDRSAPEKVDGDLMELDVEAMAALFEKMHAADMSDADYRLDQIARRIPSVGRGPDLRRHQAAKYRRKVLKELVAWWIGMQPEGRDLGEKHRRFYHRFGVDIGTAFTLSAKDTDVLIDRVKTGFGKDMLTSVR